MEVAVILKISQKPEISPKKTPKKPSVALNIQANRSVERHRSSSVPFSTVGRLRGVFWPSSGTRASLLCRHVVNTSRRKQSL